ncbi:MAG: hypothetical protein JXM70_24490 [Pirellulales bacterium]|nr:hypothetical protein [Pirellulales bacterium]
MSTISTRGLPFGMNQYTLEEIQASLDYFIPEETGSTAPLEFQTEDWTPCVQQHPLRSLMAKAVIAFGTVMPSERSRPISHELIMVVRPYAEDREEVADFFEPVTFNWDEDVFEVREAIRRYSEQIHADY